MKLPRLFGPGRPSVALPLWDGSPEATPVHAWLDRAGFPWREMRAALAVRYGVRPEPAYQWDVIAVPTEPPLLSGLIMPPSAQAFGHICDLVPAVRFSAATWFGRDARENMRRTAGELEPHLGRVKIARENNVIRARWRFGPSSVALVAWPPDLQGDYGGSNPAHERDPRLDTACHVTIETGYRPPLSAVERGWVDRLRMVDELEKPGVRSVRDIQDTPGSEGDLEYVRMLPGDGERLIGRIGVSDDGLGLIFCTSQLYAVPMAEVMQLRLDSSSPGRGGGGEWLSLECGREAGGTKALPLAAGSFGRGLDAFGATLAQKLGRPYEVVDLGPDV